MRSPETSRRPVAERRRPRGWVYAVALVTSVLGVAEGAGRVLAQGAEPVLRIGFVRGLWTDVSETDALAAMQVLGTTLASALPRPPRIEVEVYASSEHLIADLRTKRVDLIGVRTEAYPSLRRADLAPGTFYVSHRDGKPTERYVLLVPEALQPQGLAGLRQQDLYLVGGLRTGLSQAWIDTELAASKLPPSDAHFARVTTVAKTSQAVLPVFFKKAGACVVSRTGFETVREMNPQVGRALVILAESPPLLPSVLILRQDYDGRVREDVARALLTLHASTQGRQVLDLFGIERLVPGTDAELIGVRDLLEPHHAAAAGQR